MKKSEKPVVVEQSFSQPVEKVWRAITEPGRMRRWFFDNIPDFKAQKGFETRFEIENEGRVFPHLWKVIEVVPNQKLVYNWRYAGYPGDSNVIFELTDKNNQTTLKLTHVVLEDFPDDIPEFSRESCLGGWHYFINESLKNYLGKE